MRYVLIAFLVVCQNGIADSKNACKTEIETAVCQTKCADRLKPDGIIYKGECRCLEPKISIKELPPIEMPTVIVHAQPQQEKAQEERSFIRYDAD